MPIQVTCANADCAKTLRVKDELAGKTIRCPGCQQSIKLPAAADQVAAAPAAAAAKKSAPPPPPPARAVAKGPPPPPRDDEEDDAPPPKKKGGKRARSEDDDVDLDTLWEKSAMLKHDRFLVKSKWVFFSPVKFTITNPDTKDELGTAKENANFGTILLRGLTVGPVRFKDWMGTNIEIRDSEDGPVLFTVRKPVQMFSFTTKIQVFNQHAELMGYFQTKLFSFTGGFWVYDAEGEQIAEVQPQFLKSKIRFLSADGRLLATINSELAEGKGFKFSWGVPGLIVTMDDEVRDHTNLKVLLLATTIAMEFTGVGKRFGGTALGGR